MPITYDRSGRASYIPVSIAYFRERPEQFLPDREYRARVAEGRMRVLEAIRFAEKPLAGHGKNHSVALREEDGRRVDLLTDLVDRYDRRKYDKVKKQRARQEKFGLAPNERRLRSPQDIKRRRSRLFKESDIPEGYFGKRRLTKFELSRFVDLMRWYIIRDAILVMYSEHELEYINNTWYIPVTVMDKHRKHHGGNKSNRVKRDDRSSHGDVGTRRDQARSTRHTQGGRNRRNF